jgi:hypothetical protein
MSAVSWFTIPYTLEAELFFRGTYSPPFSGLKSNPKNKAAEHLLLTYLLTYGAEPFLRSH